MARSKRYYAWETHCDLPCANYCFEADGKMVITGLIWLDGKLYYVEDTQLCYDGGLRKIGEDYYFVTSKGYCATGTYNCWATYCDLPTGTYEFGADCKMIRDHEPTPTPVPTATPTATPTVTPTATPTATPTVTPTATPTATPTVTPTAPPTATPAVTPTATPTVTPTVTPEPTATPLPADQEGWNECEAGWYYVQDGSILTGYRSVPRIGGTSNRWYDLGEDGISKGVLPEGLYEIDGKLYYIIEGVQQVGLHQVEGDYYFFLSNGDVARSKRYYAWETHCDLPCANYCFEADGKMVITGLIWLDGKLYYVEDTQLCYDGGLRKIGEDYYFVTSKGYCATGTYNCWATYCDLPTGTYEFDADCKMIMNGWNKRDGEWYYVKDDVRLTGYQKVESIEDRVTKLWYDLGEDGISKGVLPEGLYEIDGKLYYIIEGVQQVGLHQVEGDYYFFLSNGDVARSKRYYAWETHCDLPCANYCFEADGKMVITGLIWLDGKLYYVEDTQLCYDGGLRKIGEDYYFVTSKGYCATGTYNCWATYCDLPTGTYEFGADGKMLNVPQ